MKKFLIMCLFLASLMMPNICSAQPINKKLLTEEDGFKWYRLKQGEFMGAESESGKILIPLSEKFSYVQFYHGRFLVNVNNYVQGIYDLNGNEIFSPQKGYGFDSPGFDDKDIFGYYIFFTKKKDGKMGMSDLSGNDIVPCIYDLVRYSETKDRLGFFYVSNGEKKGAYDLNGKEIVPCIYNKLYYDDDDQEDCFKYVANGRHVSLNVKLKRIELTKRNETVKPEDNTSSSNNSDYGYSKSHGKILKRTSEKDKVGTVTTTEWYEDGYYSILVMQKCSVCGGTGKSLNGLYCTNCAAGFTVSTTYVNPTTGDSYTINSTGSSGSIGNNSGYSGGSSSGSNTNYNSGSTYTKCTSCNGTGRCTSCSGRGIKFNSYSGHDDTCPSCRGKGSCPICYGRGKL